MELNNVQVSIFFLEDILIGKKEFSYWIVVTNWQAEIGADKSSDFCRIKNWPGEGSPSQSAKYWQAYELESRENI